MKKKWKKRLFSWLLAGAAFLLACGESKETPLEQTLNGTSNQEQVVLAEVPEYSGSPYVELNGNEPEFTEEELTEESYETYSRLDGLGRCGEAEASVGEDLMPTKERERISEVKPTGWHYVRREDIDGMSLYNRCHLIAYQLTAENANEKNLITGTRYMNAEGMQPFENAVANYIHRTDNHVMYRVTPIFEDDNLVVSGVVMEAESVEDDGEGISFHVYVYNVQPGYTIDYATGDVWEAEDTVTNADGEKIDGKEHTYILNTNTLKFHKPDCDGVQDIWKGNKKEYTGLRKTLIDQGYSPCGRCAP